MKRFLFLVLAICLFQVPSVFSADNWETWRGPGMSGISETSKPPVTWSETENIKWKVPVSDDNSASSPIIWGNKIIFHTAVMTDEKVEGAEPEQAEEGGRRRRGRAPQNYYKYNVVCLDKNTGKQIWETMVLKAVPHEGHHPDHGFASYSPITDGELIWSNFGSRGLYCLDMDGNIKWQKDLPKMNIVAGFGEGNSPAIVDGKLILLMDHQGQSKIMALDKANGKVIWEKNRDENTTWTSPFIVEVGGKKQIVANGEKMVCAYNPDNGDVIWSCTGQTANVVPTPVIKGDVVYCTSGFRGAKLQAIKLGHTGNLNGTDAILWEIDKDCPYVPSPILYGDRVYVLQSNNGVVSCYNTETGDAYYTKEKMDEMKNIYASPVAANGNVYFTGRNGVTYVISNSGEFNVVSVNKLDDQVDASVAIVGDEIFIKGKKFFYCIAGK